MEPDTGTRWLSEAEQRAWRTHLDVTRLLTYQLGRDLQPFGLTMHDYEILVHLSEAPKRRMRMTDLASATLQSKSRLSHQITRMENAGLVRREHCDSDRRGLFAVLTDAGWETMLQVAPHHVASVRRHFIDLLAPSELAALRRALEPVAEHLRAERGRQ
ncbi:MarR family winged helix-turn-helix transcriptional regulator [Streptomyces sp. 7-21]|jgi:DNA-binding MarR family transcriptional regulator|uniref:MarR family winged helix-turn-helix transcriptional regulator n=1 Tax=Streptomyces sp. 7-21 TaxID=2802283 RepID=UPI00191EE536|nr:MarR family transcriptional regulator [Streptomyces sp. 7-21]MBL1065371.1 MarR family transcriptional regulator [Streptomyces sp. 7-21]